MPLYVSFEITKDFDQLMRPLNRIIIKAVAFFLGFINLKLINRFANFKNRIYSELIKKAFKKCGKGFYIGSPAYIIGAEYITIGDNFESYARLRLEVYDYVNGIKYTPRVTIGNNVAINFDCHIGCINEIIIGDNVLIASKVFITDHLHGDTSLESLKLPPRERPILSKGAVTIGNNVWIGEGVAIMPNVTIGDNCVIGANAVVTKSFAPYSIIGGVPAKLIRNVLEE
jgi:acetyltransferase-like isoleucine patch superfamily enzyme